MLQEIADTLQAPKQWLWSMLPGLHDDQTGQAYTGAQVAQNAFGTDPNSVWGKALGFGLDVAGDPLNVIAPFAARGLGAVGRGLGLLDSAGGAAAAAMPAIADTGDALAGGLRSAAQGAAGDADGIWGRIFGGKQLPASMGEGEASGIVKQAFPRQLSEWGNEYASLPWRDYTAESGKIGPQDVVDRLDQMLGYKQEPAARQALFAAGFEPPYTGVSSPAPGVMKAAGADPGAFLASQGGAAAGPGGGAGSGYSALRDLRSRFGMVKQVQPLDAALAPEALDMAAAGKMGRGVIDPAASFIGESTGPIDRNMAGMALQQDAGQIGGAYYPKANMGWADSPATARHEIVHGLIDQAAKSGETAGLPMVMRVPAALQRSSSPFLQGTSNILNEAAAHGLQNRGMMPQLGGYLDFLLNPELAGRSAYAEQAASKSPLAAALYQSLPYGTAAGLAGGSYAAGNQLFGGP